MALDCPGPAPHRIGSESRLVPEIDLGLLQGQLQFGQHLPNAGETECDTKLVSNHLGDDVSCPQAKVEIVLARVIAINPTEHLLLLSRRQDPVTAKLCVLAMRTLRHDLVRANADVSDRLSAKCALCQKYGIPSTAMLGVFDAGEGRLTDQMSKVTS